LETGHDIGFGVAGRALFADRRRQLRHRQEVTSDQVTSIIGAIGTLFTVAWGLYVKAGTRAVPSVAAARPDVPTVSAATGAVR
jgi:hypothetical protein